VRSEPITPLEEDLLAMVGYAASSTFDGADEDRWRVLSDRALHEGTDMLWACAQVHGAAVAQAAAQWEKVLVISWVDEPGVVPITRQLASAARPVTVLLGGEISGGDGASVRRNQAVLAELLREQTLTAVIYNAQPDRVLDVVLESARSPVPLELPRSRPMDLGPLLDLPPTWCLPAPPVQFFHLVYVPIGAADGLSTLAVDVAARRALYDLMSGPPVDIAGEATLSVADARAMLPEEPVQPRVQDRIRDALDRVVFRGQGLLVEQIEAVLRPVLDELTEVGRAVVELERSRLHHLRQYTAVGIQYTCQTLAARMDAVQDAYPSHLLDELQLLLSGTSPAAEDGSFPIHAWRNTFAGLHSEIVNRRMPGARTAVSLVQERFELFNAEYSAAMGRVIGGLVGRARDDKAPASSRELRTLKSRAWAIKEALESALADLDARIALGCEAALRADRLVHWACGGDANQLQEILTTRIQSLPCAVEVLRSATDVLAKRRLGMVEDRDFEELLDELRAGVSQITGTVETWPTYEACLMVLLDGRDPPVLRQALAASAGSEVELHLERPVEPALMNWLTATGMLVVVSPRLQTCAIYWQRVEPLSRAAAEVDRSAHTEHFLADLVLPPPEGDSAATLVGMIRAVCYVLVGLAVGELRLIRHESLAVHGVRAASQDIPDQVLLPHGALHLFAHDPERLARLGSRLEERILALPYLRDGADTVGKLIELATLGPSPTLAAQVGIDGVRFQHLEHPILALLGAHANLAVAAMVDCLHSQELDKLTSPRKHRALLDVQQLSPSGS